MLMFEFQNPSGNVLITFIIGRSYGVHRLFNFCECGKMEGIAHFDLWLSPNKVRLFHYM